MLTISALLYRITEMIVAVQAGYYSQIYSDERIIPSQNVMTVKFLTDMSCNKNVLFL